MKRISRETKDQLLGVTQSLCNSKNPMLVDVALGVAIRDLDMPSKQPFRRYWTILLHIKLRQLKVEPDAQQSVVQKKRVTSTHLLVNRSLFLCEPWAGRTASTVSPRNGPLNQDDAAV